MDILFICNGNVARSQEAETFFNDKSKHNHALSAGINVKIGKPIDPLVIEVMEELGYPLKSNVRKLTDKAFVEAADLIVSFKPYDELPESIREHEDIRYWTIADPQHHTIEFHRQIRDKVKAAVDGLIEEIG